MPHVANLTIDGTTPSATHTNFPKLIRGQDLPTEVWDAVAPDGGDLRFFLSDGTTEVAREVVSLVGSYLSFDGTDDLVTYASAIGHDNPFGDRNNTSEDWEVEFLVSFSGANSFIHGICGNVSSAEQIIIRRSDGLVRIKFHAAGVASFSVGAGFLKTGTPYKFRFVKAAGAASVEFFLDGVSQGSLSSTTNTFNVDRIGYDPNQMAYFSGNLHYFKFTDNLTPANSSLYDARNISGTTWTDSVGSNDGTLVNGPTSVDANEAEIWALIPELTAGLSGTDDTVLQIHADGVSSDYAVTDTYGRNAVFSGSTHRQGGDGATDVTGSTTISLLGGAVHTGAVNGFSAIDFPNQKGNNNADARARFDATTGENWTGDLTVSAWVNADSLDNGFAQIIGVRIASSWEFSLRLENAQPAMLIGSGSPNSSGSLSVSTDHLVAATVSGSTISFFLDGSPIGIASILGSRTNHSYGLAFGGIYNGSGSGTTFNGRIANADAINGVARSADWIADEYADQDGDSAWHNITAVTSGYSISLDAGTVVLAGQTVDFDYTPNVNSYSIDLEAGTVSLVGDEVNLLSQRTIGLEAGEVALDGQAVTLTYNQTLNSYTIDLDAGTVTLSGEDIETALARALIAEAGTVQLGGAEVQLHRQALLELDAGEIELSGAEIELAKQLFISLEAGEISLASAALELQKASLINLEAGDVVIDGQDISLSALGNAKVISTLGILHAQNGGGGGTSAEVGSEPPSSPSEGDLWYDTDSGQSYIFVNDGSSSQWAPVNPPLGGSTGQGFADYNDSATSTTPVSITADVWEEIPNDGLGAFTNTGFIPATISSLFSNDKIDVSDLDLGDAVIIRYDFTLTPSVNGAFGELRLSLGSGLGSYYLNRPIGTLSNGSGYDYQVTGEFYIYMGDANTRDNPIGLEVRCSEDASLVNAGVVIQVIKR